MLRGDYLFLSLFRYKTREAGDRFICRVSDVRRPESGAGCRKTGVGSSEHKARNSKLALIIHEKIAVMQVRNWYLNIYIEKCLFQNTPDLRNGNSSGGHQFRVYQRFGHFFYYFPNYSGQGVVALCHGHGFSLIFHDCLWDQKVMGPFFISPFFKELLCSRAHFRFLQVNQYINVSRGRDIPVKQYLPARLALLGNINITLNPYAVPYQKVSAFSRYFARTPNPHVRVKRVMDFKPFCQIKTFSPKNSQYFSPFGWWKVKFL